MKITILLYVCASIILSNLTLGNENVVFSKVFSDGTSIKSVFERINLKCSPNSIINTFHKENSAPVTKFYSYTQPADVWTIFFTNKQTTIQIERFLVNLVNLPEPPMGAIPWAIPDDVLMFDTLKIDNKVHLLFRAMRNVYYVKINLDNVSMDINGCNDNAIGDCLFDETWAKEHRDVLPIVNGHIIPVEGGAYLFFEAKTGNHFLWEFNEKKDSILAWKKGKQGPVTFFDK